LSLETVRLGLKNLRLHKLRSFLTALGIVFGVGAVICMLSISEGASESELQLIRLLGTSNIILKSIKPERGSSVSESDTQLLTYGLTGSDIARIQETVPHVKRVVPLREVAFVTRRGSKQFGATVVGAPPDFFSVIHIELAQGRALQSNDERIGAKVCVIGDEVRQRLFPLEDPIGQTLSVSEYSSGTVPFTVVGVIKRIETAGTPAKGIGGRDLNADVIIPLSTADARYGDVQRQVSSGSFTMQKVEYSDVYVEIDELEHVLDISRLVARVMEFGHEKPDYSVNVPLERLKLVEQEKRNRQYTLGSIAGVSLLVGGIGIMNIMLASVTERTREIGIRRALGAKQRHITSQFLVETVVLSTCGGLIGVILGCAGAKLFASIAEWPTIIRLWTVVISFGLSMAVGVFFGMFPAISASKLDPIEALRHE
jgi:putative ABC transport system permease protein